MVEESSEVVVLVKTIEICEEEVVACYDIIVGDVVE